MSNLIKREICPVCESGETQVLYSAKFLDQPLKKFLEDFYGAQGGVEFEYLKGEEFKVAGCKACGLIYQVFIPDEFLAGLLYTKWISPEKAYKFDILEKGLNYYVDFAQSVMTAISYFKKKPSELKFLDFGMGWGAWARMACSFGCDSYGVELSEYKAVYAKSYGVKLLNVEDLKDFKFDLINVGEVLEHINNPLQILCKLKNSLNQKGLIKISVPDGAGIKRKLQINDWSAPKGSRNSLNPISPLEHINCFSGKTLLFMASRAGFKKIRLPLSAQYASFVNKTPALGFFKNILRPVYRNYIKKEGADLFFTHS